VSWTYYIRKERKRMLKKKVIGILLVGLLIGTIFAGCIKKEEIGPREISIKIDPRIELMYAVMCSTTSWAEDEFTELDFEYKDEFFSYFSKYKDHEAVKMADHLVKELGWMECLAIPKFMLSHTEPPDFKLLEDASPDYMQGDWAKFTKLLRNYIKDTDFMKFYEGHERFYKAIEKESKILAEKNYPTNLESYYGMEKKSYTIILAPLRGSHPVCISVEPIIMLTPTKVENNIPIFEDNNYMCLRMFSHGFVHQIIFEHMDEVNEYEELFKPSCRQIFPEWHRFLNAQIIEAILARYILHTKGKEDAMKHIDTQYSRGFIYTEPLYYKLAEYEENRDKYHSFENFFPEILTFLSNLDPTTIKKSVTPQKEWTFMYYGAIDCNLSDSDYFGRRGLEAVGSSDDLNIIALIDTDNDIAYTYYVKKALENGESTSLIMQRNGEIDMTDYTTLYNFITYCKKNYPAKRYFLSLTGHGRAWEGAMTDDTNNPHERIKMDDIGRALKKAGGVDIVAFDSCSMAAIEVAYELRDCVKIMIAHEERWVDVDWLVPTLQFLKDYPRTSNIDIAKEVIKTYDYDKETFTYRSKEQYPPELYRYATTSAIRMDKIPALVSSINAFAKDLIPTLDTHYEQIVDVCNETEAFPSPTYPTHSGKNSHNPQKVKSDHLDIYDFVDQCEMSPQILQDAGKVKRNLKNAIVAEYHGDMHEDAHGLTIYFPGLEASEPKSSYDEAYASCGLDFAEDTSWDKFLVLYVTHGA
jgi:hypothetical protein